MRLKLCEHGIETHMPFWIQQNNNPMIYKPLKVDMCLTEIITALLRAGIRTYGSCCGHFTYCGDFIIASHSIYNALKHGYNVTQQWMVDLEGNEFQIYHLNLLNNCKDCHANIDPICPCHCSCHRGRAKYTPHSVPYYDDKEEGKA